MDLERWLKDITTAEALQKTQDDRRGDIQDRFVNFVREKAGLPGIPPGMSVDEKRRALWEAFEANRLAGR